MKVTILSHFPLGSTHVVPLWSKYIENMVVRLLTYYFMKIALKLYLQMNKTNKKCLLHQYNVIKSKQEKDRREKALNIQHF